MMLIIAVLTIRMVRLLAFFLDDGTLKCNGDIYRSEENLDELSDAFVDAMFGIFTEKYGIRATYSDVKYDPISYLGDCFLLTGTAKLDDYYNYDYRNSESYLFCICVTPLGGSYSDRWYIYAYRNSFDELFEELKKGPMNIAMVCRGYYLDSIKNEMADLVDYCID